MSPIPPPLEVDSLYLDLNGLLHLCAEPWIQGDLPSHLAQEETWKSTLFDEIAAYVDQILSHVTPRRAIFLAIDGVAPRAKLNQQRQRRFREIGNPTPEDRKMHRNEITPGTPWMETLDDFLQCHWATKIRNHAPWREIQVVYAGPLTPGEGEHKMLDWLRHREVTENFCLYGLDADLILLGLGTGRASQGWILREETSGQETHRGCFRLLSLRQLQRCLTLEMLRPRHNPPWIPFPLRLSEFHPTTETPLPPSPEGRCNLDFILLSLLLGNDFLPRLRLLELRGEAFDLLFALYHHHRLRSVFPFPPVLVTPEGDLRPLALADCLRPLAQEEWPLLQALARKQLKIKRVDPEVEAARPTFLLPRPGPWPPRCGDLPCGLLWTTRRGKT